MGQPLKVIIVEDRASDAELMVHELRRAGYEPQWHRVDTEDLYRQALASAADVILADFNLPQFNAPRALEVLHEAGRDVPLIVVTGSISEEVAVEMMKKGASDYLLKDRLTRLGPAVSAALQQKRLRDAKRDAEESLRASEERLQMAVSSSNTALWDWDIVNNIVIYSPIWKSQLGYADDEIADRYEEWATRLHPDDRERVIRELMRHVESPAPHARYSAEFRLQHRDGSYRWILSQGAVVRDEDGRPVRMLGSHIDITSTKRAEEELRRRYELERLLFQELDHRVRNNLASLLSLIDMTRRGARAVDDFASSIDGRVRAMSTVHALLSQSRWTVLDLRTLIDAAAVGPARKQIIAQGERVLVPAHQVNALGIILHELMTNSAKHGALRERDGRVSIHWHIEPIAGRHDPDASRPQPVHLVLRWIERGGPTVAYPEQDGVGTTLIHGLTRADLRGAATLAYPPEGADHTLRFTLDPADESDPVHHRRETAGGRRTPGAQVH